MLALPLDSQGHITPVNGFDTVMYLCVTPTFGVLSGNVSDCQRLSKMPTLYHENDLIRLSRVHERRLPLNKREL